MIAPVGYNYGSDAPVGAASRPGNAPVGAILTTFRSRSSTLTRPKTMRGNPSWNQQSSGKRDEAGHGALYLEGSVLGRWLTQYLNREIVRPRAGIMAVDPRITPSWGGPSLAT